MLTTLHAEHLRAKRVVQIGCDVLWMYKWVVVLKARQGTHWVYSMILWVSKYVIVKEIKDVTSWITKSNTKILTHNLWKSNLK